MPEDPAMVGVGLLLMLSSRFARHAVAPLGGKLVTDAERLLLFSFGLLALVVGLVRIIQT